MPRRGIMTVQKDEPFNQPHFHIIRLAGSGSGMAEAGQTFRLRLGREELPITVEVLSAYDKRLNDLDEEDAGRVQRSAQALAEILGMYRFRPQWKGADTLFRILELKRSKSG